MSKFADQIKQGLKEAVEHSEGKRELRTTVLPAPPPHRTKEWIIRFRSKNLKVSQAVFARSLNVSVKTVQAWEQGVREPSGSALKLLAIAEKSPEMVLD